MNSIIVQDEVVFAEKINVTPEQARSILEWLKQELEMELTNEEI